MGRGFHAEETIGRPADEVWQTLTDFDGASRWMGPVEAIEVVGGGALQQGAELAFTARGGEHRSTVTAFEPGKRLEMTSTQSGVTAVYDYRLEPAQGGTRVTLDAACTATGWIRLIHPLINYMMKRVDGEQITALKTVIEKSPP